MNKSGLFWAIICFTAGLSAETISVNKEALANSKVFSFNLEYDEGVTGNVTFNGIPIDRLKKDGGDVDSNFPQFKCKKGSNRIGIKFETTGTGKFTLTFNGAKEMYSEEQFVLFEKEIPFPAAPGVVELDFDLGDEPSSLVYTVPEKFSSLGDNDKKEIYKLLQSLQKALKPVNKKQLLTIQEFFIKEQAALDKKRIPEMQKEFEKNMNFPGGGPASVHLPPLNKLIFEVINDNMVLVHAGGKAPVFIKYKDGGEGEIKYIFGKINGKWKPVISAL